MFHIHRRSLPQYSLLSTLTWWGKHTWRAPGPLEISEFKQLEVKVEIGPEKMHIDDVWCATVQFQSKFSGSRS